MADNMKRQIPDISVIEVASLEQESDEDIITYREYIRRENRLSPLPRTNMHTTPRRLKRRRNSNPNEVVPQINNENEITTNDEILNISNLNQNASGQNIPARIPIQVAPPKNVDVYGHDLNSVTSEGGTEEVDEDEKWKAMVFSEDGGEISYHYGLYAFLIILIGVASSFVITLWPQHNVIENNKYWYEIVITYFGSFGLLYPLTTIFSCATVMSIEGIKSMEGFLWLFSFGSSAFVASYALLSTTWVYGFGYNYPMPFIGSISLSTCYATMMISLWFYFPQVWVSNKFFRQRLKAYIFYSLAYIMVQTVYYEAMYTAFSAIPSHFQWVLTFLLPIVKIISEWILTKIAYRASGKANYFAKLCATFAVGCIHSMFLVLVIGYTATDSTSYLVFTLDITWNLVICVNAIKLFQKAKKENKMENMEMVKELVLKLVLTQIIEYIIPLLYGIILLLAFYGPNAEIIGNVKNDYWQYEKIDNVWKLEKYKEHIQDFNFTSCSCYLKISFI